MSTALLDSVERYYTGKVFRHGATALGVDWNSPLSQRLRFVQLLKVVDWSGELSLHDVGCGYGALLDHLRDRHPDARIDYVGTDLSSEMIRRARGRRRRWSKARFAVAGATMPTSDYAVASGIFNVRLDQGLDAWEDHVAATLAAMAQASRRGFAVNFMSPAALLGRPGAAPRLYGPDPARWAAHVTEVLRCDVQVLAGYGLPEHTLLARVAS